MIVLHIVIIIAGDVSQSCKDFKLKRVTRNFFETSHGRGPQDAAGGFVKKSADMAVMRGTHIIQNAKDLFSFADECLQGTKDQSSCSRRIFRYIEFIERKRPDRYFAPVKENRKIHQVISTEDGLLRSRELSCFTCESCRNSLYEACTSDSLIGQCKCISMKSLNGMSSPDDSNENLELSVMEDRCNLVNPGNIIAVRNVDDDVYPYYLLQASSCVVRLRKPYNDKWGSSFYPGNEVIFGYYFQTETQNFLKQTLIKRKKAAVPSKSMVYICNELDISNNEVKLSDSLHRRILKSLQ